MICDTSVWIDLFQGGNTWQTETLSLRIERNLPVFICPVIIQEVLQGVRKDANYDRILHALVDFNIIDNHWLEMSIKAAELYRHLRVTGVTVRKPNDCLIAAYAIDHKLPLLHQDRDFDQIARHSPLEIYQANV